MLTNPLFVDLPSSTGVPPALAARTVGEVPVGRRGSLAVLLGLSAAVFFVCRPMFTSHFDLVPGGPIDGRIAIYVLEHWHNVFLFKEHFFELNMFYPDRLALGYSDAYFVFGVIYSIFRVLGFDYFSAFQLLYITLAAIGYASAYLMFSRLFRVNLFLSVVGSVLLVGLNAIQNQFGHVQLLGFYFYPLYIFLAGSWLRALRTSHCDNAAGGCLAWIYLISLAALLALMFFTSYYASWFFVFGLILYGIVLILVQSGHSSLRAAAQYCQGFLSANSKQLLVGFSVFLTGLIPFMITYIPVANAGMHFAYSEVWSYSPALKDMLNLGGLNLLWAPVLRKYGYEFGNMELSAGYTPLLGCALLFFLGLVFFRDLKKNVTPAVITFAAVALLIPLLIGRLSDNFSLWQIIYRIAPGAAAIRAVSRFMIASDIAAVIFVICSLNLQFEEREDQPRTASARVRLLLWVALPLLLILEQANQGVVGMRKSVELAALSRITTNGSCRLFYVEPGSAGAPLSPEQTAALMGSMKLGIPTLNGWSGLTPRGWDLSDTQSWLYSFDVHKWAVANQLDEGSLCSLNFKTGVLMPRSPMDAAVRIFDDQFDIMREAVDAYLANHLPIDDLNPESLERHRMLDDSFAGYGHASPDANWTSNGFWIGKWGQGYAIGYSPIDAQMALNLYDAYAGDAAAIYFPWPARLDPNSRQDGSGQILIVFEPASGIR